MGALIPPTLGALSLERFARHWTPDSEGRLSLRVPAAYCLQGFRAEVQRPQVDSGVLPRPRRRG